MTDPNTPPQPGDPQNDQPTLPNGQQAGQPVDQPGQEPTRQYPAQAQPQPTQAYPQPQPTQAYPQQPSMGGQIPPQQPQAAQASQPVGALPVGGQPQAAQSFAAQAPAGQQTKPVRSQPPGPARDLPMGRTSRTALRTIVGIVGALALILPVSAFAIGGVQLSNLVREEATHDLPVDAEKLVVDVDASAVFVTVGEEFDVPTLTTTLVGQKSRSMTPDISDENGTTTVSLDEVGRSGAWFPGSLREETRVEIELPADYARDLDLDVSSRWGYTEVVGEFATVSTSTDAGAIHFDVIAQDVTAETGTGYIDGTGTMDTLSLDSSTGYIETQRVNVARELSASTRTGSIDLGLGEAVVPVDGITATTSTGWVEVSVPREDRVRDTDVQGYSVDATSSNGTVSIDVKESHPGDGIVPIVASASSGDVDVTYQSPQTVHGDADDEDMDDESPFDDEDSFDEEGAGDEF